MTRTAATLLALLALAVGLVCGWAIGGAASPEQQVAPAQQPKSPRESEPILVASGVERRADGGGTPRPGEAQAPTEGRDGDGFAERLRDADPAETLALVSGRASFTDDEIAALLDTARKAEADRNKAVFLELAAVLARSKHPDAIALLVALMRGETGDRPPGLHGIFVYQLMQDAAVDLTELARHLLGADGIDPAMADYGTWVGYLAVRGTDQDCARLFTDSSESNIEMVYRGMMYRDPARAHLEYRRALADERVRGSDGILLLQSLAHIRTPECLDALEGHIRNMADGHPPPHDADRDYLLYLYFDALESKTIARAASFLAGVESEEVRLEAVGLLQLLYKRGHRLGAFDRLASQPARTIRRLLPKQDELTAEERRLFLRAATKTSYEYPPLLTEENISALEEAAEQWTGEEAKAIRDKATHYRQKLGRRTWR